MKKIGFLFMTFLLLSVGTVVGQESDNHDVTVEVEEFSYLEVGSDLSVTLNALDIKNNNGGATGDVESVENPNENGVITVNTTPFTVDYGTNLSTSNQIRVKTDGGNSEYQLTTSPSSETSISNVITAPGGSEGSYVGQVSLTNSNQDLVTGVSQVGATLELSYSFEFNQFDDPDTQTQTVTYTITAN